jgi:hypothetical protein
MIDLNDSDLLAIDKIDKWMQIQQKTRRNIDQFTKDVTEKFANAGFKVDVQVKETNEEGVYGFEVEIQGRTFGSFDPDKQVYEVTNNILELPDQEKGFIKTHGAAKALLEGDRPSSKGSHHH